MIRPISFRSQEPAPRSKRDVALVGAVALSLLIAGCAPQAAPAPAPEVPRAESSAEPPVVPSAEGTGQEQLLLATLAQEDTLAVIDPAAEGPVRDRIVVGQAPWGLGTFADTAYVATAEGLAVVDLPTRTRTALVPFQNQTRSLGYGEYREGGLGLAVSPDGSRVYVGVNYDGGPDALEVFDTASGAFVGEVPVGLRPFDVLITPDGKNVVSIDHDSFTATVVDTETLNAHTVEIAPFGTQGGLGSWEKPHYGAVDETGRVLLPVQGQSLVVLDPATGSTTTEEMTSNSHQHGTAVAKDPGTGAELLLGVGTGSFGSATGDPNLTIRDLKSGEERLVPLNRLHETVTTWQDAASGKQFAALGGGYTRAGGWDGITLVALDTGETSEIPVPGYPQVVLSYTPQSAAE